MKRCKLPVWGSPVQGCEIARPKAAAYAPSKTSFSYRWLNSALQWSFLAASVSRAVKTGEAE